MRGIATLRGFRVFRLIQIDLGAGCFSWHRCKHRSGTPPSILLGMQQFDLGGEFPVLRLVLSSAREAVELANALREAAVEAGFVVLMAACDPPSWDRIDYEQVHLLQCICSAPDRF